MADRELLELAAKAAGAELDYTTRPDGKAFYHSGRNALALAAGGWFAPLADDGDALRLLLCMPWMALETSDIGVTVRERGSPHEPPRVYSMWTEWLDQHGGNMERATRRAIVRAAAEIGKAMP